MLPKAEMSDRQPVSVVTGGGGGIGGAIAEELGRRGHHVVLLDPMVSLDGSEKIETSEPGTLERIHAQGGSVDAVDCSVSDSDAVAAVFGEIVGRLGRLDSVINVAGISRPTTFASGTPQDIAAVLSVHLGGYLNILESALAHMAPLGRGRILGVTSGSGWRPADAGAYGWAKRAVASLTWQLGPIAPGAIAINAMSPIAYTRMVAAALARASGTAGKSTGNLALGAAMPAPAALAPMAAHMVEDPFSWCRGQVVFLGGPEIAVVDPPRTIEWLALPAHGDLDGYLSTALERLFLPSEATQTTTGASNPRMRSIETTPEVTGSTTPLRCAVVGDDPLLCRTISERLTGRGLDVLQGPSPTTNDVATIASLLMGLGELDALVLSSRGPAPSDADEPWRMVLAEHRGLAELLEGDGAWAHALAEHARVTNRPLRFIHLLDARTSGGRSRSQAVTQMTRGAVGATKGLVSAFAVSVESGDAAAASALAAALVTVPGANALSGAELFTGEQCVGLRSHPAATGSLVLGEDPLPPSIDRYLADAMRLPAPGPATTPREKE